MGMVHGARGVQFMMPQKLQVTLHNTLNGLQWPQARGGGVTKKDVTEFRYQGVLVL